MEAKLALKAMTLRGIGSYLHGARLEFRPLTILCGTNGSGKSTWFKALKFLKHSLDHCPGFPFENDFGDQDVRDIQFVNAYVHLRDDKIFKHLASENEKLKNQFGPPCCVGLELEATSDFVLNPVEQLETEISTHLGDLLWKGNCVKGTTFMIRITHPTHWEFESRNDLDDVVELWINGSCGVRFTGSYFSYTVTCSPQLLPSLFAATNETEIEIGDYNPREKRVTPIAGLLDEDDTRCIIEGAIARIRELSKLALDGYFSIEAIRNTFPYGNLKEARNAMVRESEEEDEEGNFAEEDALRDRHVGQKGQYSWFLMSRLEDNMMDIESSQQEKLKRNYCSLFAYASKWCEYLLQAKLVEGEGDLAGCRSQETPEKPTGFLNDESPKDLDPHREDPWDPLDKLLQPCFYDQPQPPRQMSSGFHQLFPLIVQSGLMRRFELMAIENPEVHLHPGLQLRVAEFLLEQAKVGKWNVIETHSDLIIRRVMRAILEEQISEHKVHIYFAELVDSREDYHYSTLKPIEIDERGRIANWPDGFMDDDVQESQRLLDIMYGGPPAVEDDE